MWPEDGASCLASDMKGIIDCIWHMMKKQKIQERSWLKTDNMQELDIIWYTLR